jgi:hypothetical protein
MENGDRPSEQRQNKGLISRDGESLRQPSDSNRAIRVRFTIDANRSESIFRSIAWTDYLSPNSAEWPIPSRNSNQNRNRGESNRLSRILVFLTSLDRDFTEYSISTVQPLMFSSLLMEDSPGKLAGK